MLVKEAGGGGGAGCYLKATHSRCENKRMR